MNQLATNHASPADTASRELTELLEQAMSQPGVKEFMRVYGSWEKPEAVARRHRQLTAVRRIVTASNASTPVIRGVD